MQTQAVLTHLLDANFTKDAIPLCNFEFQKTYVPLLTKDFFSRCFQSCKFFVQKRVSCVKKWNLKAIRSN